MIHICVTSELVRFGVCKHCKCIFIFIYTIFTRRRLVLMMLLLLLISLVEYGLLGGIYRLGMVMGRGRPLLRICVGGRKPDARGILLPVPLVNLLHGSGGAFI